MELTVFIKAAVSFFTVVGWTLLLTVSAAKDPTDAKPVFRTTSRNITVAPGERAVLKCKVENLGTKTVTWRKEDEVHPLTIGFFQFAPDTRITVDYNQRTMEWSLIIQDIKAADEGVYLCQISTKYEKYSYDIKLNVKTIQVSGTEYVERGAAIQLVCNVTGKPEPPLNIDWFKGHKEVKSDTQGGVIITKKIETKVLVSMLLIRNSRPEDSGEYVCRSSDSETSSIKVQVLNETVADIRQLQDYIRSHSSSSSSSSSSSFSTTITSSLRPSSTSVIGDSFPRLFVTGVILAATVGSR